ncbi:unnamed protein product (macronuclear) [Paramecium tetraurelia]|uniref:Cyclin-dependent kinases regulatory subunit n=1 Tax=Paramecium tetraurelia TaxID=5888 RepID=A0E676_PARTE|nr:uncharacterized protein GSPATT00003658001 [Paramecium tetraurelia]CAK90793.1 unnamed protein product [Paramecium tetraurelia]|eukprot:XP_001458190.1 hypothetical protein (macronuclear) [Paramecium tetraurelia strain d4-2]
MPHYPEEIEYSDKYFDDYYEYRHVILPKHIFKKITKGKLLNEMEWRALGDGLTMKLIDQNLTFFSSEEQKTQIPILDCLPPGFSAPY